MPNYAPNHLPEWGLNILTDPAFETVDGVWHGFFTRHGGVSEGIYDSLNMGFGSDDVYEKIAENRRRACAAMAADHINTVHQVHGAAVVRVTEAWEWDNAPKADAMVTDRPGIALGILTADCAPVLFCDPKSKIIGAAHAGWRGAVSGVLQETVSEMIALGAHRHSISAIIGPTIGPKSYEVGLEFPEPFLAQDPKNRILFQASSRNEHSYFDLPGYIVKCLKAQGIAQVGWIGQDSCAAEDAFFSYRRATLKGENDYGRLLSAILIKA
ncbi:MAG: peptidoglycan editing factor PgeF [Proteobacteria bacterium]|nr:peptidoglycan editing factor PgeF [Pseudomonadota bacterium]